MATRKDYQMTAEVMGRAFRASLRTVEEIKAGKGGAFGVEHAIGTLLLEIREDFARAYSRDNARFDKQRFDDAYLIATMKD